MWINKVSAQWDLFTNFKNFSIMLKRSFNHLLSLLNFSRPLYRELLPKGCPLKNFGQTISENVQRMIYLRDISGDLFNCLKEIFPFFITSAIVCFEYTEINRYNRVRNLFVGRHSCAAFWIRNDWASKGHKTCWPVNICWYW